MTMREKIRQAYDSFTPSEEVYKEMEHRLRNAAREQTGQEHNRVAKPEGGKKPWLRVLAAALTVALLGGGALWLISGTDAGNREAAGEETRPEAPTQPEVLTVYRQVTESREYQAGIQWQEYLGKMSASRESERMSNSVYATLYACGSGEMADALNTLAREKDLHLVTTPYLPEKEAKARMTGGLFSEETLVRTVTQPDAACFVTLPGYDRRLRLELRFYPRGTIPLGVWDLHDWEGKERTYTAKDGTPLSLYLENGEGWVLSLTETEILCIHASFEEGDLLTEEDLNALGDNLNPGASYQRIYGVDARVQAVFCPDGGDLISLAGMAGSREFDAALEYEGFLDFYDPMGEILKQNNETSFGDSYLAYECYSPEMKAKIDAICEKYQLQTLQGFHGLESAGDLSPMEAEGIFTTGYKASVNLPAGGYAYTGGTFQMDGTLVTGEGRRLGYQLRRSMKGYFDTTQLNVGDRGLYDTWQYTTWDSVTVTLTTNQNRGQIFLDLPDCTVTVSIQDVELTKTVMEAAADCFAFSVLK